MRLNRDGIFVALANKNMSQKDLSKITGLSESTITEGFSRAVRPKTAGVIAKALNVSVESILIREEKNCESEHYI